MEKYSPTLRQVLPRVEQLEGAGDNSLVSGPPCPSGKHSQLQDKVTDQPWGLQLSPYLIFTLRVHQACLQHIQGLAQKCGTSALREGTRHRRAFRHSQTSPHDYPQATLKEPFAARPVSPGEVTQESSWPGLTYELESHTWPQRGYTRLAPPALILLQQCWGTYCNKTGDKVSENVVGQVPSAEDQLLGLVIAGQLWVGMGTVMAKEELLDPGRVGRVHSDTWQ